MSELEQVLVERSREGTTRGAAAVWAGAVRGDDTEWSDSERDAGPPAVASPPGAESIDVSAAWNSYVADDLVEVPRARRWAWAAAAAAVVLIAGAALLAVDRFESESAPADTPPSSIPVPTAEENARADALWEEQFASGWVPYLNEDIETGETVTGWARVHLTDSGGPDLEAQRAEQPPSGSGMAIYDSPDGNLIGYQLNSLGFVPLDRINEIDPAQARIDEYGCDPNASDMAEAKRCGDQLSPGSKAGASD